MNTKFGQSNLKPFVTLNCEDLEFSLKGVSVAAWQISMIRHETGSCNNSAIQCPIFPKLDMFDKTPDLKRSTCPYSAIVIAPPAGNRKWHVLLCNELLLEIWWHENYIWSVSSKGLCDVKLWRTRVFVEGRVHGGLTNYAISPRK